MVFLQQAESYLKAISFGDLAVRRNPLLYGRVAQQLRTVNAMGADERRDWMRARLETALRCASRTPYGHRVGGGAELSSWPLLTKDTVRDDPGSLQPPGTRLTIKAATGGTTGLPLQLARSLTCVVVEQACIDVLIRRLVLDPKSARIATLRGDNVKAPDDVRTPFWRRTMGGRRLILSSNHLSRVTVADYVAAISDFSPDLLWVYPSVLQTLCHLIESEGLEMGVAGVLSSSEMLHPHVRALAERVLGCRLVDFYGQAERVAMAYSGPKGYNFFPGYSFVELVPSSLPDESSLWEIVGTSLWNTAMPLVRYRTGDLVQLPEEVGPREREEIALGLRPFPLIQGRDKDVLYAANPPRILTGIDHIQRGVAHVERLQFLQPAVDRVTIQVLAAPGYEPGDTERIEANARRKIPGAVKVKVTVTDTLTKTGLGKTPFIVRSEEVDRAIEAVRTSQQGAGMKGEGVGRP